MTPASPTLPLEAGGRDAQPSDRANCFRRQEVVSIDPWVPSPLAGGLGWGVAPDRERVIIAHMANARAKLLRSVPTDAERKLWSILRRKQIGGHRFRRQHPLGRYIVDFVCLDRRFVVEVDGGQHAAARAEDAKRTAWLESRGYRVIRFWNNEVLENLEGIVRVIEAALDDAPPLPDPPPRGGRE